MRVNLNVENVLLALYGNPRMADDGRSHHGVGRDGRIEYGRDGRLSNNHAYISAVGILRERTHDRDSAEGDAGGVLG